MNFSIMVIEETVVRLFEGNIARFFMDNEAISIVAIKSNTLAMLGLRE